MEFGFRAVSEQFSPTELLQQTTDVERVGFDFITISDHFHPWFHTEAQSPFSWVWIASAAQATNKIHIGTGVTSPIFRYNPAVIAQAFATLDSLYPNRIFLTLGTGEGMNEVPVGYVWPTFSERAEKLEEALEIIRSLWRGSFVDFTGKHFKLRGANLYTKPNGRILVFIAARGRNMARFSGRRADGLYTHSAPHESLKRLLAEYERGRKEGDRGDGKSRAMIELLISYSEDHDDALRAIERWRSTAVPKGVSISLHDPRRLEELGSKVTVEEMKKKWLICGSLDEIIERVEEHLNLGFTAIEFHLAKPDDARVIDLLARKVLPYFREKR